MKRTISVMLGKGSVNHNSRLFKAENIDAERTQFNISYCNTSIKDVYHELFDAAVVRYNAKQTRADRCIDDYYEKIRAGKQEKLFKEVIFQIGNISDMAATNENGQLAAKVLTEFMCDFQSRNPNLRVFSAHLHMDEATPHLHVDFVPFITGSNRGLDTRVSLKQALAAQGFTGGTRFDTEWNQWVKSEKEQLAAVMTRHGIEWEQLGTHEEHLSVLDYKKQEREHEIVELDETIADKTLEHKALSSQIRIYDEGITELNGIIEALNTASEYQLPEPQSLISAKSYKEKIAEPLIKKLKSLIKTVLVRYFEAWDNYHRLNVANGNLYRENERLSKANGGLTAENKQLKEQNKDYALLRKVFGNKQIDGLLEQAKSIKQAKQRDTRSKNNER